LTEGDEMTREDAIAKLKDAVSFALEHGHMVAFLIVPDIAEMVRMLESEEKQEAQDGLSQNAERALENGR
jgi:hypothetical protein